MAAIEVATFDCYGTLVDWEGGAAGFLYDMARRHGDHDADNGRALRERWEEIQFDLLQQDYRTYSNVLHESLRAWAGERGYRWNENDGDALERSMQSWQPFPDTIPALTRAAAAGLRLVIFSNTDNHILEHTLRQLEPLSFDATVVAQDVETYKPDVTFFRRGLEAAGAPPEQILHVAFGFKYDIAPAQELGMQTAWVNRHQEPAPGEARPDHEWRDLWGLAELAESRAQ